MVGNVTRAVDADEGSNAIVYYFIAGKIAFFTHVDFAVFDENVMKNYCKGAYTILA